MLSDIAFLIAQKSKRVLVRCLVPLLLGIETSSIVQLKHVDAAATLCIAEEIYGVLRNNVLVQFQF